MFEMFDKLIDFLFPTCNVLGKVDRLGYPRCDGYNMEDYQLCLACDDSNKGFIGDEICPRCGGYGEFPIGLPNSKTLTEEENNCLIKNKGEKECLN